MRVPVRRVPELPGREGYAPYGQGFKPFWNNLELPEMAAGQVSGTVVAPRPDPERVEKRRENGNETDPVKSACEAGADSRTESDCAKPPR